MAHGRRLEDSLFSQPVVSTGWLECAISRVPAAARLAPVYEGCAVVARGLARGPSIEIGHLYEAQSGVRFGGAVLLAGAPGAHGRPRFDAEAS